MSPFYKMKTRGIITIYDRQVGSPRSSSFLRAQDIIRHDEYRSGRYLRIPYKVVRRWPQKSRNSLDDRQVFVGKHFFPCKQFRCCQIA